MKRTLKVLLAATLSVAMLFSFAYAAEDSEVSVHHDENRLGAFVDAPAEDSWKFQGLNCAVENGVMNGHENKLRPDDSLTRAEMVTMMVRILGAYASKADIEHYVDVALGEWYYETMQSGVAIKIINGSGNKMMPNDAITREQTFTILARTFLQVETDKAAADKFSDAGSVSDWAKSATNALIETGVVLGDTTNTIRPKADVTRAEFAAMLDRIACYMAKPDGGYAGKTVEGSVILNDSSVNLDGAVIEGDLYITDAVGTDTIDLSNVTVTGRVVIRGGEVNIKEGSSASQVVIGNPTNNTTVKADEGVKVDKVVVAENSNNVEIDVPANEVVINSSSSEVTINKDTSNVTVSGTDNTVKVTEGTKVDNVKTEGTGTKVEVNTGATVGSITTEGSDTSVKVDSGAKVENVVVNGGSSSVSGNGNVGNATINGSDSTVTTPNTNVTDNTKPSGDDNKPTTGGGGASLPSGGGTTSNPVVIGTGTYITYSYDGGEEKKLDAEVSNNVVKFDFAALAREIETANGGMMQPEKLIFKDIYVDADKEETCKHDLVSFSTKEVTSLSSLLVKIVAATGNNNVLVPIDDVNETTYAALREKMAEAYRDAHQNGFDPLFDELDIDVISQGEAKFTGKVGTSDCTFHMVVGVGQ